MPAPLSKSRVSFSQFSQLALFPEDKTESSKKWYSKEENRSFRQQLANDIRQIRRNLPANDASGREYEYVGIETLLSPEVMRLVAAKRRHHIAAILEEQRRRSHQQEDNNTDSEALRRLSQISEKSSRWSCKCAYMRANNFGN